MRILTFILLIFIFSGCRTAPISTPDTTGLATAGGREAGRLDELNRSDERIQRRIGEISGRLESVQSRFTGELESAARSTGELREIIQRIFGITDELLNEIEGIRAELDELAKLGQPAPVDSRRVDSP